MPLPGCVDVAEETRIRALLGDPRNHSWPALDCEALDGFVPDLGLTGYANPSVYRPPSVVRAGVRSTVRHRFRVPVKNPRLPGTYFLALLVYDAAGEELAFEISLGADPVGVVAAHRHDNRRHLLVLERAIRFDSTVKWVQAAATCRGACRLERLALLAECPLGSSFAPTIEALEVAVASDAGGSGGSATVHCITYPPASLEVTAHSPDAAPVRAAEEGRSTLHALALPALLPKRTWTVRLKATEQDGAASEVTRTVDTGRDAEPEERPLTAELELAAPTGPTAAALAGLPLRFGVPVPRARLHRAPDAVLEAAGSAPRGAQTRIHSRWPDGSARWVLVDAIIPEPPPSGPARALQRLRLHLGGAGGKGPAGPLTCSRDAGETTVCGDLLRVTVRGVPPTTGETSSADHTWLRIERRTESGGWDELLVGGPLAGACDVRLGDGAPLQNVAAGPPELEQDGGHHAVVRLQVAHRDRAGHERLRSDLRLHVHAGQPFCRLVHRLLVVCAEPGAAQYVAEATDERETLLAVRCCALRLPWRGARELRFGGTRYPVDQEQPWLLRHEHDQARRVGSAAAPSERSGRVPGHVVVRGDRGLLALGVRNFWQTYPKGLQVEAAGVAIELLPPRSGGDLPGDAEAWHRLYPWLDGDRYLLREGLALTTEVLVGFPADAAAAEPLFRWLEEPPVVRPLPAYTNGTGALPRLAAKEGSPLPEYEALTAEALRLLQEDREANRAYGHLNYGDWYGEGDWCWGNNEYDTPYGAYWEFLRGGDPAWARWGDAAARHLADVDTVNCFSTPSCVGLQALHMPAHLGGYLPPLFRSKVNGTRGIPSHTWLEGALLHYLLTGDEGVRDSLSRTADWLLRPERLDHYEFSAVREAGWHLIHLSTLAAATGDPRARNGAAIVVRRILEKQDSGGAWTRMLTSGHCWCGYPHCRGNIAFMVTVLLSGMKRYHDLTGDPAVAESIVAGARWLIRETLDRDNGLFIGGSCTTMQRLSRGEAGNTQIVIEGIADAYALSGDAELGHCLQRALPALSQFPDLEGHRDLGKRLSQQMRYVPTVLAALEGRPQPV